MRRFLFFLFTFELVWILSCKGTIGSLKVSELDTIDLQSLRCTMVMVSVMVLPTLSLETALGAPFSS